MSSERGSLESAFSDEGRTYYEILCVQRSCSHADVRRAYLKLAVTLHPDRNPESDAEDQFKRVAEAFSVLSDAQRRAEYDRRGAPPASKMRRDAAPLAAESLEDQIDLLCAALFGDSAFREDFF